MVFVGEALGRRMLGISWELLEFHCWNFVGSHWSRLVGTRWEGVGWASVENLLVTVGCLLLELRWVAFERSDWYSLGRRMLGFSWELLEFHCWNSLDPSGAVLLGFVGKALGGIGMGTLRVMFPTPFRITWNKSRRTISVIGNLLGRIWESGCWKCVG